MKTVLISPYSRKLRTGVQNPKDFPYWNDVIKLLKSDGYTVIQVGGSGETRLEGVDDFLVNLTLDKLAETLSDCDTWASVDNFFQHFAWYHEKKGVAIFSQSDPLVFGHNTNINLLKSRSYLRPFQYDMWEKSPFNADAFVSAHEVFDAIKNITN